VSEPSGLLDSDDRQRWQFFAQQGRSQQQSAQRLAQKLPAQGSVEPGRQSSDQALALAWLQTTGRLTWNTPFDYQVHGPQNSPAAENSAAAGQPLKRYFQTRSCRWKFLLESFGFAAEAQQFRCDRCDNCRS
jgi:ATP-dependent DNA helicase RecQ